MAWIVEICGMPYYVENASNPFSAVCIAAEQAIVEGVINDFPREDLIEGGWEDVCVSPIR